MARGPEPLRRVRRRRELPRRQRARPGEALPRAEHLQPPRRAAARDLPRHHPGDAAHRPRIRRLSGAAVEHRVGGRLRRVRRELQRGQRGLQQRDARGDLPRPRHAGGAAGGQRRRRGAAPRAQAHAARRAAQGEGRRGPRHDGTGDQRRGGADGQDDVHHGGLLAEGGHGHVAARQVPGPRHADHTQRRRAPRGRVLPLRRRAAAAHPRGAQHRHAVAHRHRLLLPARALPLPPRPAQRAPQQQLQPRRRHQRRGGRVRLRRPLVRRVRRLAGRRVRIRLLPAQPRGHVQALEGLAQAGCGGGGGDARPDARSLRRGGRREGVLRLRERGQRRAGEGVQPRDGAELL
mmetsp:Transcript_27119/g.85311  ORF Transcript_27119/g.85311 Transcript_27119/m.85311 type:complete len:348 (+) Transcript_27119:3432-4475(+)